MQLKLKRTQRDGGLISTTAVFCLDARVELTPEEKQSITRYKLQGQVIYNSESAKKSLNKSIAATDAGGVGGLLKGAMHLAITAMKLNISIGSLERGHHIECKSLDELLGAEDAIMTACENLKAYLNTALTFDGTEIVVDFSTGRPQLVAQSSPPQHLIAPPPPAPLIAYATENPALPAPAHDSPYYEPTPEWTGSVSNFRVEELWENPVYRKRLMIGAGVTCFLLLLRACHIL